MGNATQTEIDELQNLANAIVLKSVAAWENVTGEIARLKNDANTMRTVDILGVREGLDALFGATLASPPAPPVAGGAS